MVAMQITLKCPHGHVRRVGLDCAGTSVPCLECGHVWHVPPLDRVIGHGHGEDAAHAHRPAAARVHASGAPPHPHRWRKIASSSSSSDERARTTLRPPDRGTRRVKLALGALLLAGAPFVYLEWTKRQPPPALRSAAEALDGALQPLRTAQESRDWERYAGEVTGLFDRLSRADQIGFLATFRTSAIQSLRASSRTDDQAQAGARRINALENDLRARLKR